MQVYGTQCNGTKFLRYPGMGKEIHVVIRIGKPRGWAWGRGNCMGERETSRVEGKGGW